MKKNKIRIKKVILIDKKSLNRFNFYQKKITILSKNQNFQLTFQLPLRRAPLKKSATSIAFLPACCNVIIEIL